MKNIHKLLIANRGEIAIRIARAAKELGIQTVGIYSKEDVGTLHRQKMDESYLIGDRLGPIEAYLDIEGIIDLAKKTGADAIHPGYGFLSESEELAKRCQEEGIIFVGPEVKHLQMFGNKTYARRTAIDAGLQVIPGSDGAVKNFSEVEDYAKEHGYPLMIKAVSGGGGKGMRIVREESELRSAYDRAQSEAVTSFGDERMYIERYVENPKHIEIQILGDHHGNVVHLYERDSSIQRRHQKVVETAPSFGLSSHMRKRLTDAALQLMEEINYLNAGTVEFLVAGDDFYFIEVNPRIQVEHTITEMITGVDLVKTQLLIADGKDMFGEEIGMPSQEDMPMMGYAIQCRITTEDPQNDFLPDSGRIIGYHSPGGFGVRLDAGDAFTGSEVTPHYDSLLVKISTHALRSKEAIEKMQRALSEMKIRGVKTNIRYLENILDNQDFQSGNYDTSFIDAHPELFEFIPPRDRAHKLMKYLANITVNGFPGIPDGEKPQFELRQIPETDQSHATIHPSSLDKRSNKLITPRSREGQTLKHLLDEKGPEAVQEAVLNRKEVLVTDTTLRDAHQSLLTTRLRTRDMEVIAPFMNETMQENFSLEMWGGATFDVAYNFLKESPWQRLSLLRELIPDIPFQMLLRASNAVGYRNYPDNVVEKFIHASAREGIDVFRIFDSLNWLEAMKLPIQTALETNKVVEGTICYTGDLLNPQRSEIYTLDYFVNLAKEIEALGVHTLAVKDMAGILKPEAAYQLIGALKEEIRVPIHLHTHDTSGNGIQTYSRAIDAGVDIVDTANESISGFTAQPSGNTLYYAREGTDRQIAINAEANNELAKYWKVTRSYYEPFEADLNSVWSDIYTYETPGGQYSNLKMQAESLGLGERYQEVLAMYRRVNMLFGDIIKVTPSSKVVGDMALFMVQNDLDETSVIEEGMSLDFPQSVIQFFKGEIGQPVAPMNKELQKVVLKGEEPITDRPGNHLEPFDFEAAQKELSQRIPYGLEEKHLLSYALYPQVYIDFLDYVEEFGIIDKIETPAFFYGLEIDEVLPVEIELGKTLMIKLSSIGPVKENGQRTVFFEVNGMSYSIDIQDLSVEVSANVRRKAERSNSDHIGAQMPGTIFSVEVKEGQEVSQGDVLIIAEAMKMETTIQAPKAGVIKAIHVEVGDAISVGDLLIEYEN